MPWSKENDIKSADLAQRTCEWAEALRPFQRTLMHTICQTGGDPLVWYPDHVPSPPVSSRRGIPNSPAWFNLL